MKTDQEKLELWKRRLDDASAAYQDEVQRMEARDKLYKGDDRIRQIVRGETAFNAPHVRNIVAELIESEIDSTVPAPKVEARKKADEPKAKLIEDMLRNEIDRLPFEVMNDIAERTVPIQGGAAWLVEWDNAKKTHDTVGELAVSLINPREIVPQDGVFTGIEDMDYIILRLPQTKAYIKSRYGVDVEDESESEPDMKGGEESDTAEDMVTQYAAYYRNKDGGIGYYSWVNDVQLEDLEDYQARQERRCADCGEREPITDEGEEKVCPVCGGKKFISAPDEYEIVHNEIIRNFGPPIPGDIPRQEVTGLDALGQPIISTTLEPTRIPYYKPDIYPVILQNNITVYGQLLGASDVDLIADQQNTINRLETKIIDKIHQSGSYMTLPPDCSIDDDSTEEHKVIRVQDPAEVQMISVHDMEGNIQQDMAYLAQVYEEARQILGITDSFQGRKDTTASSGKAKEFAAAQTAGRLESKRAMKRAAFAALYEAMFKFKLAYADEPRPVVSDDDHGVRQYQDFNRYDFLEQDEDGNWYWNDQFLFSCDTSAPLASNREAMWQETRANFQTGAFGDPADINTLILFWTKMEMLHYPGAADTKTYLESRLQEQMAAQQQQMMMQQQMAAQAQAQRDAQQQYANDQALQQAQLRAIQQARSDAQRDAQAQKTAQQEAREAANFIDQRTQSLNQIRMTE